jgi:uncharacterized membrane protein
VLRREWLRDRFWALPSFLLAAGVLLAALTAGADALGLPATVPAWPRVTAGTAETVLSVIATSMLTFVGVVFTITLVALQLASAQLSPRVLRTFVRSSLTKLAFGVFLATFAFAATMLVLDPSGNAVVESRSVSVASLLVAASLVIFVGYATATMKLLQVGWVITAVAEETRQAVRLNFPPADAYLVSEAPRLTAAPSMVHLPGEGRGALGVLLGIDRAALVELARRHQCVLELLPRIGSYLNTGAEVFAVHGGTTPSAARVLTCVDLGRARSLFQDPAFGIRQLVDVAAQALSPAMNQATTAIQVIDRLEDILIRILRAPAATGCFVDDDQVVRLLVHPPSWEELLDLAFLEIIDYGSSSAQVSRRLFASYEAILAAAPGRLRPGIEERRAHLMDLTGGADAQTITAATRSLSRLGLG